MSAVDVPEPQQISLLPMDKHHRRVPWFVQQKPDGEVDFRVAVLAKLRQAVSQHLCWVCGLPLTYPDGDAYVIGPMCTVNRISAEPPSHRACARYSVQACPFLNNPQMRRRETGLPEERLISEAAIMRNPGVNVVWCTPDKTMITDPAGHPLFELGTPKRVWWYTQGRVATRAEAFAAMESGLPIALEYAREDGPDAVAYVRSRYEVALQFLPAL